jgi:26S proteasome regulatory subunit N7
MWRDYDLFARKIAQAKIMVDDGGDWDRRNRLKAYEALYFIIVRQFSSAGTLLLEILPTFTSYELFSYNRFVLFTVLMAIVAMDRSVIRKQVVKAPEILAVIKNIPNLELFLNSFFNCQYDNFFRALVGILDAINDDYVMGGHKVFFTREIRIVAYSQYLESYQSVTLANMADAFGVSASFIDSEVARFIASGRLHAKIDAVAGVIHATRAGQRSAQYTDVVKEGDMLLNRIQKLSRVVNM